MYKIPKYPKTTLEINTSKKGERIEQKVARILSNKEKITDGAPTLYTERKEGVLAAMDIRTDKWEEALDAKDTVTKHHRLKRQERIDTEAKVIDMKNNPGKYDEKGNLKGDGKAESTQGTK